MTLPVSICLQVATDYFRGWHMPAELTAVQRYMDTFMGRDSWKHTYYAPELVIAGWEKHGVQRAV